MTLRSRTLLISILLFICSTVVCGQKKAADASWLKRAQQVTDDLISDVPRLSKTERALILGRVADVWWRDDPERARVWFKRGVELVEPIAGETASDTRCRLAAARVLFSVLARRDAALNKRLLAVITDKKQNQDLTDRTESAAAMAAAAIAIAASDPETAESLGESSLNLAPSIPLGNLLWRLRSSSPAAGDKFFVRLNEVAAATMDALLFSILTQAVTLGPFKTDDHKRQVLRSVAQIVGNPQQPGGQRVFCQIVPLQPQLLTSAESLVPEHAQRLREAHSACSNSVRRESSTESDIKPVPTTIEELLTAAGATSNTAERTRYLSSAVNFAAAKKDFDRAISILDSMNDELRQFVGEAWENWRWHHASSAACAYRKMESLQSMQKTLDDTPARLRALVRIDLALNCDSFSQPEIIDLLSSARSEITKTEGPQRLTWFLALLRLYGKFSPEAAPTVLLEVVAELNRSSQKKLDLCGSAIYQPTVLTNQLLLSQYKLPLNLWIVDGPIMLHAVAMVEPPDKRVALRLNLISGALAEQRKVTQTHNRQVSH